jgi:mono/diheme cytochrome c family protein
MPNMRLTDIEAESLAYYLFSDSDRTSDSAHQNLADAAQQIRGEQSFQSLGCAQCHAVNDGTLGSSLYSLPPALEDLADAVKPDGERGCLSASPGGRAADFSLHPIERDYIRAFLASVPLRRSDRVPLDELCLTLQRLDCAACHSYHAEFGPEEAIVRYFRAAEEADLGDEGRLPPDLTDVGGRLNQSWLLTMLSEGGVSRPYLAARMPQYGHDNVRDLPRLLTAASGIDNAPERTPPFSVEAAAIGRELAGVNNFNCIQCHNVAGHPATGTPGPDLALAAERLRYDAFQRWILDPTAVRPGTRMPRFFYSGYSAFRDFHDGRAKDQVDALWAYVSQGEQLPLPPGIETEAGLTLDVSDEPLVFRTFMQDAGVRAIACGFPEQVHGAFDADRCELTLAWQGRFLDAGGAWVNRGGTETNPDAVQWKLGRSHTLEIMTADNATRHARFHGYKLDELRRPVFMYELTSVEVGIDIVEHITAHVSGNSRSIRQQVNLKGEAGTRVQIELAGRKLLECTPQAVRMDDDTHIVTLDASGAAEITLEVAW